MKRGAPKDEGSLSDGDDPGRSSPRSRSSRSSESSNPPTPPSSNSPSNSSFPSPRPNNEKRRGRSGVDRPQQRPSLPHRRRALSGEHHQTTNQPAKKGRRNILKQLGTFVKKMKKKVVRREEGVKRESLDSLTSIESYSSVALLRERLDDVGELASRYKVQGMMAKVRSAIGASDLMRELRLKREEYARKMEDLLVARRSNRMEQDHPYVALRKKIEAMALAEGASYSIECEILFTYVPVTRRAVSELGGKETRPCLPVISLTLSIRQGLFEPGLGARRGNSSLRLGLRQREEEAGTTTTIYVRSPER